MKKTIVFLLIWISFQIPKFANGQNVYGPIVFAGNAITQCEYRNILIPIFEAHVGITHRGDVEIIRDENITKVIVCYYLDEDSHFTADNFYTDSILLKFPKVGSNKLFVNVKHASEYNDIKCDDSGGIQRHSFLFEVLPKEEIIISPNPVTDFWVLRTESKLGLEEQTFVVYSIDGRLISKYSTVLGQKELFIDAKPFSPGVYFIKNFTQGECYSFVEKLIKA
jgi:hypothetical protein